MIRGFGLKGYRSFYGDTQYIGPMEKVHLIIGQNNVGKSNILRFAAQHLKFDGTMTQFPPFTGDDMPRIGMAVGAAPAERGVSMLIDISPQALSKSFPDTDPALTADFLQIPELHHGGVADGIWLDWVPNPQNGEILELDPAQLQTILKNFSVVRTAGRLNFNRPIDQLRAHLIREFSHPGQAVGLLIQKLTAHVVIPPVQSIEAFRQIRPPAPPDLSFEGSGPRSYSGMDLVAELADLKNPGYTETGKKERFAAIEEFVREVLDDPAASLDIPFRDPQILVTHRGVPFPLDSLGTGVHETIIIAAAATVLDNHLVCLEEPEVHLHPLMQRRLLRYLHDQTSNQYLIATHSAHMLDAGIASVSHVETSQTGTLVRPAVSPRQLSAVVHDLGYRASDLLQSNFILWVEGPSDRTYINAWLTITNPKLVEGVHYSVMFYGGKLLSHLTVRDSDEPDPAEVLLNMVRLSPINRHTALVMDSDKKSAHAPISDTKRRIRTEFDEHGLVCWMTAGYTIENYVPVDVLTSAVVSVHPTLTTKTPFPAYDRYSLPLTGTMDKNKIALHVAANIDSKVAWQWDFHRWIHKLSAAIDAANADRRPADAITKNG